MYSYRLISHQGKWIYHQLPKCASKSMRSILVPLLFNEHTNIKTHNRVPLGHREFLRYIPESEFKDDFINFDYEMI